MSWWINCFLIIAIAALGYWAWQQNKIKTTVVAEEVVVQPPKKRAPLIAKLA